MSIVEHPRAPLGLPPGSIRGILSMEIVAIFWVLLLVADDQAVKIPINLYFLLSLVMVFFVAHGKSIAHRAGPTPSPLWLPGGTLRFLILAGSVAVLTYVGFQHPERFERLNLDQDQLSRWKNYLAALGVGFVLGYCTRILPFKHEWWYQAFQAWIAIIAMAIMFLDLLFQVLIQRSMPNPVEALIWHTAVTGIVAFYFGSRS